MARGAPGAARDRPRAGVFATQIIGFLSACRRPDLRRAAPRCISSPVPPPCRPGPLAERARTSNVRRAACKRGCRRRPLRRRGVARPTPAASASRTTPARPRSTRLESGAPARNAVLAGSGARARVRAGLRRPEARLAGARSARRHSRIMRGFRRITAAVRSPCDILALPGCYGDGLSYLAGVFGAQLMIFLPRYDYQRKSPVILPGSGPSERGAGIDFNPDWSRSR